MPSQSYIFGHKCIPAVTFADPHRMMTNLGGPTGPAWLAGLWNDMGAKATPNTVRPPDGLRAWVQQVSPRHVVGFIQLPQPWADAEAYFVVIIGTVAPPQPGLVNVRVFTLERGMDFNTMQPCTHFCEWTHDDIHKNHGVGPPPNDQAFVHAALQKYGG